MCHYLWLRTSQGLDFNVDSLELQRQTNGHIFSLYLATDNAVFTVEVEERINVQWQLSVCYSEQTITGVCERDLP